MDVDADKANRHNNANNHNDANNHNAANHHNDDGNDYRADNYSVNNASNHNDANHHVGEYHNRQDHDSKGDAKGYARFAGSSAANPKSVYAEDYLEGGLDELSPEEAQVVVQSKRTRRWKGVILDDEEYILRVFYTSFLSQLVMWISGIALLVGLMRCCCSGPAPGSWRWACCSTC